MAAIEAASSFEGMAVAGCSPIPLTSWINDVDIVAHGGRGSASLAIWSLNGLRHDHPRIRRAICSLDGDPDARSAVRSFAGQRLGSGSAA